ncbi:MAG: hypothetical protein AAF623_06700, partial [Planctomycetota bacterium]
DSEKLEFRGPEIRWSVQVGKGTSAKVDGDTIKVTRGSKSVTFTVGSKADHWQNKILNPPTLATKLGLKKDQAFTIRGSFDNSFQKQLLAHGLVKGKTAKTCDICFILLESASNLSRFDKLAQSVSTGTHIWAVFPKGAKQITRSQVIAAGKLNGMGPGKGISFDAVHSAMRFTRK